jgi:hypothetical protein
MAGRFLAVEEFEVGTTSTRFAVRLIDVKTRRTLRRSPTGSLPPERQNSGTEGIGRVSALELNRNGRVGWIVRDEYATTTRHEVWSMDRLGAVRVDEGAAIDPESLAIGARFLYWSAAGEPHRFAFTS